MPEISVFFRPFEGRRIREIKIKQKTPSRRSTGFRYAARVIRRHVACRCRDIPLATYCPGDLPAYGTRPGKRHRKSKNCGTPDPGAAKNRKTGTVKTAVRSIL